MTKTHPCVIINYTIISKSKKNMTTWNIDKAHSEIGFKIKHLMVSNVRGHFNEFDGTITMPDENFANANIEFSAKTASINTKNEMRDGHLQSAEFFNSAEFPTINFTSSSITNTGDEKYVVKGNLTMHGVTKEITLDTAFNGVTKDMEGNDVMSFEVTGSISRNDFDLTWNKPIETGGVVLSDEVKLDMNVEFKK